MEIKSYAANAQLTLVCFALSACHALLTFNTNRQKLHSQREWEAASESIVYLAVYLAEMSYHTII